MSKLRLLWLAGTFLVFSSFAGFSFLLNGSNADWGFGGQSTQTQYSRGNGFRFSRCRRTHHIDNSYARSHKPPKEIGSPHSNPFVE